MPRTQEIRRARLGIEQTFDGGRTIVRGDAGGRQTARFDGNGEGRFVHGGILAHHLRNVQFVESRTDHRHADQPAGVLAHKVDRVGRDHLGGHDEIALVLAILVVEDDHHLPGTHVGDRVFDLVEGIVASGQLIAQRGKEMGQPLERAIRRLAAPRAQQRNGRLGQTGTLGDPGGGKPGLFHRGVQQIGKAAHRPQAYG